MKSVLLLVSIVTCFLLDLMIGTRWVPIQDVFAALTGSAPLDPTVSEIITQIRFPRALIAMAAGAALACGGLLLQDIFRNPLAGPWALGVTAGAKVGAAVIVVLGAAAGTNLFVRIGPNVDLTLAAGAFVGSVVTLAIISSLARSVSAMTLLVCGLMFHYGSEALTGVVLHFSTQEQARIFTSWKNASFHTASPADTSVVLPVVAASLLIALVLRKSLGALLLGDEYARSVGVNVKLCRQLVLWSLAGSAAVVTAYCGAIVFIDIAVPHLCRFLLRTSDTRVLLPSVIATGALVGLAADLLVHLPSERQWLNLSDMTSLLGVPVVIYALLRSRRSSAALLAQ